MRLTLGDSMVAVLRTLLTLAWYVVAVGALVGAAVAAWAVLTPGVLDVPTVLGVGVRPGPLQVQVGLADGHAGLEELTGWMNVETLPTGAALACVALWLAGALVLLPAIGQSRRLTESIVAEGPFVAQNIRRLGRLGVTIIVVAVVSSVLTTATSHVAAAAAAGTPASFTPTTVTLGWAWLGFVMVALAEVFRVGVDLRDDNDLTI